MKTTLIRTSSKVRRQVILNINHLCHVLDALSQSLVALAVASCVVGSEISNTWWKVLVLRSWAVPFDGVEIELVFVWGSTNASFINHALIHRLHILFTTCLSLLLLLLLLIFNFLRRISQLVEFSVVYVHWLRLWALLIWAWRMYLSIVATCLRPPFNLILNLLGLLLVWISNLNTLTDLLVMGSI